MWVIRMPDEDTEDLGPAYWSNEVGACLRYQADQYNSRDGYPLPIGGEWEEV